MEAASKPPSKKALKPAAALRPPQQLSADAQLDLAVASILGPVAWLSSALPSPSEVSMDAADLLSTAAEVINSKETNRAVRSILGPLH